MRKLGYVIVIIAAMGIVNCGGGSKGKGGDTSHIGSDGTAVGQTDMNGDGNADGTAIDADKDGTPDGVDTDGDGKIDVEWSDSYVIIGGEVAVSGVTLNKAATTMLVGGTETLTATIAPANATNQNVTWTSNDTSVAEVSTGGVVTAKAVGSATITVKTESGNFTDICGVTVTGIPVAVTGVSLNKDTTVLEVFGTETLTAAITPANATNQNVTWTSSDTSVAEVSAGGVITAKAVGTATITVKTESGSYTDACGITVLPSYKKVLNFWETATKLKHSQSISGDIAVLGNAFEDGYAGAVYVFKRASDGTWNKETRLKASNAGMDDRFGYSVAVSGDTIVVGAYYEDSNATGVNGNGAINSETNSGAAYVFERAPNGTWSQTAYLKPSNTTYEMWFGCSVAISGDTIIVGAHRENSGATGVNGDDSNMDETMSGAAYIFKKAPDGTWSQTAYLKASNTEEYDHFGYSVAISDNTAVVGATHESSNATGVNGNGANNSASYSGAAYVFERAVDGTWSQTAYLKASNTGSEDRFGESMAVSGDTIVIGTYYEDSNATGVNGNGANNSASYSGAAYVFERAVDGTWSQTAYLKASNTESDDRFGYSVAVSGDTIVVSSPNEDSNATGVNGNGANNSVSNSGAVYVFIKGIGGQWNQTYYLKGLSVSSNSGFGSTVGISENTITTYDNYDAGVYLISF